MRHPACPRALPAAAALALLLCGTATEAQTNLQAAQLEQEAIAALAAGDLETAEDRFEEAIRLERDNPLLHLGLGVVAVEDDRDTDARRSLERALRLDPELTIARILLARMRYRNGDLFGAVGELEHVVAADPEDTESAEELESWRLELEVQDRMRRALSEHFTLSYEGPPEAALAVRALEVLDQAYWRIGQELSLYPLRPIAVVLYTAEQFRDITRSPEWAAGAYDGTAIRVPMRGALDNPAELERVLTHEFAHVLIHEIAPTNVPYWLNEGLASALEGGDTGWAGQVVEAAGGTLPLQVLGGPYEGLNGDEAMLAYATSELAVRRLLGEVGGVALANLLRDLGDGVPLAEAFQHRLYRPLDQFLANGF